MKLRSFMLRTAQTIHEAAQLYAPHCSNEPWSCPALCSALLKRTMKLRSFMIRNAQTNHEAAQLYAPHCSNEPWSCATLCSALLKRTMKLSTFMLRTAQTNHEAAQLYAPHCSPNVIRLTKWTGEVHTEFWCAKLREGVHLEDQGIDARIILKYILRKSFGRAWTRLIYLRIGTGAGLFWMR